MENQLVQTRRDLLKLLQEMGAENIWRPVADERDSLLAEGHEDMRDTAPDDLSNCDFHGKSVLDMGCNLGFYSFLARKLGADLVIGLDVDSKAVHGCRLLCRLYGLDDVHFVCTEFSDYSAATIFDVVLLINYIGKKSLVKGIQPVLDICRRYAGEAIILSVRRRYHIKRNLGVTSEYMRKKYGQKYVQGEWFSTICFLQDFLGTGAVQISPDYEDTTLKRTFLFKLLPSSKPTTHVGLS